MNKIKFYYKGNLLGMADLMEGTLGEQRHKIAKGLGIKMYDRMVFLNDKGSVRMDTDVLTGSKDFLSKEFNVEIK